LGPTTIRVRANNGVRSVILEESYTASCNTRSREPFDANGAVGSASSRNPWPLNRTQNVASRIPTYADKKQETFAAWKAGIAELGKCQNVVVKLGGLGMLFGMFDFHTRETPPSSEEL
jgi:hypothetical protein